MVYPFDPWAQNVTFLRANHSPFDIRVSALIDFANYNTRVVTNEGAQLGACLIMVILLALLTSSEKRKSPIFILNTSALLLNSGRLLCQCLYFSSSYGDLYAFFSGDYSRVTSGGYANSVIGAVVSVLLVAAFEASLFFQTHIMCASLRDLHKYLVLAMALAVTLLATGFRFALSVENCIAILKTADNPEIWVESAANITVTISIFYFSAIFVTKLGVGIASRRRLGLTRFGAMQVIFVMSCQSMVVPAIFAMLQYVFPKAETTSNVLTAVVISLPLSSLWASAATKHSFETVNSTPHRHLWPSPTPQTNTSDRSRQNSTIQPSISTRFGSTSQDPVDRLYPELEDGYEAKTERNSSLASTR
ncbi:hypothetical protein AJ80_02836 [Polytolypa hystricis UAMH7299]|uniref:Pheromone alpha factor receptor n=1 Tax=Polytolypa hystricis (strain UAMH7299) TaxID=1447883 RepID=A0A2B7YPZ8_POLH7|nr:hypothetical protein AJ80_02836 [Polytolypa hystricis UAMH7299]